MFKRTTSPSPLTRGLVLAAAAAAIPNLASAQCNALYAEYLSTSVTPAADFRDVHIDSDADELAILGANGRVFVTSNPSAVGTFPSAPLELGSLPLAAYGGATRGRIAIDGNYIIASVQHAAVPQTQPAFVGLYSRPGPGGAWTGPFNVSGILGGQRNPVSTPLFPGQATFTLGADVDVVDMGDTAYILMGDPSVAPPAIPLGGSYFNDGAVFNFVVSPSGAQLTGNTSIYRPGFEAGTPPGFTTAGSAFGTSLDISPTTNSLAVGARAANYAPPAQSAILVGAVFTYTSIINGAGMITGYGLDGGQGQLGVAPPGTVGAGLSGDSFGGDVAIGDNWLLESDVFNPKAKLFSRPILGGVWNFQEDVPSVRRVAIGPGTLAAGPTMNPALQPPGLGPVGSGSPGYGVATIATSTHTMNATYCAGVLSGGTVRIWRTDCGGDLTAYPGIGNSYGCTMSPNSTGAIATANATGNYLASANSVTLNAMGVPANQFGFFLVSEGANNQPIPAAGGNFLCVALPFGRILPPVLSDAAGTFSQTIDLTAIPLTPLLNATAGTSLYFQGYHRDGGATPNFTTPFVLTVQ